MGSRFRWGLQLVLKKSLRAKIIAWFFVPTVIILVGVALTNFLAYQQVTEELVIERDEDLARLSAGQLATDMQEFTDLLSTMALPLGISQNQQSILNDASGRLVVFDGGVVVLDNFGVVVAAEPERPELLGQDWSNRSHFSQMVRSPNPVFSNVLADGPQEAEVIVIAVAITGAQGEFLGSVSGMFHVSPRSTSAFYAQIVRLRLGATGSSYLVDGNGRVVYHSDIARIGADFSTQSVVQQALAGQAGATKTQDFEGEEIVAGFSPVPGTPWGLITEESWAELTSGSRGFQRFLSLLLILGVAVPILFVIIGLGRVMRPVDDLIDAAKEVARGNFDQTISARSGDEIEELANEFNLMANQLQESYEHLERRVADRTRELSESEERYRALFEDSRDAIFVSSADGKVVDGNQAALDIFGFTREEAIGSDIGDMYVDPADRGRFREEVSQKGSVRDFEVKLRKRDGTEMYCLLTATRRRAEDGSNLGVQGTVRDITERKQAEEALRDLAILDERNRMAREIHDTLAQGFTGIVLQLEAAEQASEGSPGQVLGHLTQAKGLARESLQEARRSVWNLLPQALEERPLDVALQEEVRRFATEGVEQASFSLSGARYGLAADLQTALLRIYQECLTNIRRHAHATEVRVELSFYLEEVRLSVKDNGSGFDVPDAGGGRKAKRLWPHRYAAACQSFGRSPYSKQPKRRGDPCGGQDTLAVV